VNPRRCNKEDLQRYLAALKRAGSRGLTTRALLSLGLDSTACFHAAIEAGENVYYEKEEGKLRFFLGT
jgi:hypothetical protein